MAQKEHGIQEADVLTFHALFFFIFKQDDRS